MVGFTRGRPLYAMARQFNVEGSDLSCLNIEPTSMNISPTCLTIEPPCPYHLQGQLNIFPRF